MGRVDIQPRRTWDAMSREEKLAWARTVAEGTRAAYEAEDVEEG